MKHVIIVEDDPAVRTSQARLCRQQLGEVNLANPDSLDDLAARVDAGDRFDLVIADTDLRGWQRGLRFYEHPLFAAVLSRLRPDALVVATSGDPDAGQALCDRATALGARCTYIGKADVPEFKALLDSL